jgi:hypothetical protein
VDFVMKTSMYGYQADAQLFAVAWLRDPVDVAKVVSVLEVGGGGVDLPGGFNW